MREGGESSISRRPIVAQDSAGDQLPDYAGAISSSTQPVTADASPPSTLPSGAPTHFTDAGEDIESAHASYIHAGTRARPNECEPEQPPGGFI
jgi:hypothetical protein